MANYALLTAGGHDRPGIVAEITRVLFEAACNVEDSAMVRLGGTFNCMLLLRLPEGQTGDQLEPQLAAVQEEFGLWVHLSDLSPAEAVEPATDHPKHTVAVYGADRPGIVHRISAHLAAQSVNITNLHTQVLHQDPPMYVMEIEVETPNFVDLDKLDAELADIGRGIGVEVSMKPKADPLHPTSG